MKFFLLEDHYYSSNNLRRELKEGFHDGKGFIPKVLTELFNKINDEGITSKTLMNELRKLDPLAFTNEINANTKKCNGYWYYFCKS